jgi:hypothetical protein
MDPIPQQNTVGMDGISTLPTPTSSIPPYTSKRDNSNDLVATLFISLSILLCVVYFMSVLMNGQGKDGIKIATIFCWVIIGIFCSVLLTKNKKVDVRINAGISFFVIIISCLLTCRQINVIKKCVI